MKVDGDQKIFILVWRHLRMPPYDNSTKASSNYLGLVLAGHTGTEWWDSVSPLSLTSHASDVAICDPADDVLEAWWCRCWRCSWWLPFPVLLLRDAEWCCDVPPRPCRTPWCCRFWAKWIPDALTEDTSVIGWGLYNFWDELVRRSITLYFGWLYFLLDGY